MKQEFYNLQINTNGQKLYEITNETINWIEKNKFKTVCHKFHPPFRDNHCTAVP